MFKVTVRDHIMIAHSLPGEVFGPAQRLHGATFIVDATFVAAELGADGIVVDMGLAGSQLHELLAELNYRNLDDEPSLTGATTTEALARAIADRIADRVADGRLGPGAAETLTGLEVTLHESHVAWARYERGL